MTAARTIMAHFTAGLKLEAVTDAAGYRRGTLAADGLSVLFGWGMGATETAGLPLPVTLGGRQLTVRDRNGTERPARLLYVSERQVNFVVPEGLAPGAATLRFTNAAGKSAELVAELAQVAPGLFAASQNGRGAPAGTALRISGDGSRTEWALAECASGACVPAAVDLGGPEDQVYLVLYGTGLRHGSAITASIGGVDAPVEFAGPQGSYEGLDQVNLRVPRELAGRGECDLIVAADGVATNTLRVLIR
jgi:uncharacterized protein (TIGR03437 family)